MARIVAREFRRTQRVIVTDEARPPTSSPIFVVGVHRSGTTLVRLLLDSHSRIACPPETFFLRPLSAMLRDAKAVEGLTAMGFPEEAQRSALRDFAASFFERYAAARGKARWADKTPVYVDHLDFIDALFGPSTRYLLVYRHGLDVACSIADMGLEDARPHVEACGGRAHAGAARYWAVQTRKMLEFGARHGDRCHALRYEHLVEAPEVVMRAVFEHLEEPWEPGVLRFHEHAHDRWAGLEDGGALESRGFRSRVGRWRSQPPDVVGEMLAEAGDVLRELGYEARPGAG